MLNLEGHHMDVHYYQFSICLKLFRNKKGGEESLAISNFDKEKIQPETKAVGTIKNQTLFHFNTASIKYSSPLW